MTKEATCDLATDEIGVREVPRERTIITVLDEQFRRLHVASVAFVECVPSEYLYRQPRVSIAFPAYSCGEYILRSAGRVEQTFGGITANLWDDPFEWTLPEALPRIEDVVGYINEAEAMRVRGFASLRADADLNKEIMVPSSGEMQTLFGLIADTLRQSAHYQVCAFATARFFSDVKLPRL